MGRYHNVGVVEQRVLLGNGRFLGAVQTSAIQFTALYSFHKHAVVHNAAPGGIDDNSAVLDLLDIVSVQHMLGAVGQGYMVGNHIGSGQQGIIIHIGHMKGFFHFCRQPERIIVLGGGTKDLYLLGHLTADVAAAYNPHHLVVQGAALGRIQFPAPNPFLEFPFMADQFPAHRQHQHHRQFADRIGIGPRRIAHVHVLFPGCCHVYGIIAHAPAHNHFQPGREAFNHRARHLQDPQHNGVHIIFLGKFFFGHHGPDIDVRALYHSLHSFQSSCRERPCQQYFKHSIYLLSPQLMP